jgi:hypothetical protein
MLEEDQNKAEEKGRGQEILRPKNPEALTTVVISSAYQKYGSTQRHTAQRIELFSLSCHFARRYALKRKG